MYGTISKGAATTTGFVLMMLGMHPQIQDKVYQEISTITNDSIQPEDLAQLKYLEFVIKGTLRLFPFGAFIVRDVDDDLKLEG